MTSGPPNTVEEGALAPGLAVGPTGPTGFATAYANNYSCASEMAACNVAALSSVSCATATSCEAVGTVGNSQVVQGPLGEGWNGTSWTIQAPPPPSTLTGISCTLKTACMAVGYGYNGSSYELVPVAASWDGSTWTIRPPPSPSNATGAVLAYVQCATANACMAVGQYTPTGGEAQPLIEFWNGSVWTIQAAPLPSGESGGSLYGVSCPSTTTCTAVGSYFTSAGGPTEELALAESWNGTSWSVQPTAATMPSTSSSLNAVWCLSAASCKAVGRIYTGSGEETLAESWNGTSWSIQPTPKPSGSTFSYFANISCAPAGTPCKAVGSSGNETLVESWDGTSWSIDTTPGIPNATESSFSDVSCTSAIACTAVGFYLDNTVGAQGARLTLAERWDGTHWTVDQTPDPPVVETGSATNVAGSSATVNGMVWPDGATVTSCYFEYGTRYPYTSTVPCAQAVGAGTSPVSVSGDLSGLTPNTTYDVVLVAANAGGTATDRFSSSFTTTSGSPGGGGGGGTGGGGSAHYSVNLAAWIPFAQIVDPEQPVPGAYLGVPPFGGVADNCYSPSFFAQFATTALSTYHGDDHVGFDGSTYRVSVALQFDWDGRTITNAYVLPPNISPIYGETLRLIDYFGPDGHHQCVAARAKADHSVVATASGHEFDLEIHSSNPLVHPSPDIDSVLKGRVNSDGSVSFDAKTDLFPSHGFRVLRNGSEIGTIVLNDASCLGQAGVMGLGGALTLFEGLTNQSNDVSRTIPVPAAGAAPFAETVPDQLCSVHADPLLASAVYVGGNGNGTAAAAARSSLSVAASNGKGGHGAYMTLSAAQQAGLITFRDEGHGVLIIGTRSRPFVILASGPPQTIAIVQPHTSGSYQIQRYLLPSGKTTIFAAIDRPRVTQGRHLISAERGLSPRTHVTLARRGKLTRILRFRVSSRVKLLGTYVVLDGRPPLLVHNGRFVLRGRKRARVSYYSVDVLGDVERPHSLR